nr:hypothetical protein [Tanacetum cinerariifolium]
QADSDGCKAFKREHENHLTNDGEKYFTANKPCVRRRVLDSGLGFFDVNVAIRPQIAQGHLQQCFHGGPLLTGDTESKHGRSTNVKVRDCSWPFAAKMFSPGTKHVQFLKGLLGMDVNQKELIQLRYEARLKCSPIRMTISGSKPVLAGQVSGAFCNVVINIKAALERQQHHQCSDTAVPTPSKWKQSHNFG